MLLLYCLYLFFFSSFVNTDISAFHVETGHSIRTTLDYLHVRGVSNCGGDGGEVVVVEEELGEKCHLYVLFNHLNSLKSLSNSSQSA